MSYKVIALDLDGTLLNDKKRINPASIEALNAAKAKGIEVLIATGRHHISFADYYHQLELTTPAICCNGVYLYDVHNDSVISSTPITQTHVERMVQVSQDHGIPVYLYAQDMMLYNNHDAHHARIAAWDDEHKSRVEEVFKHYPNYLTAHENYDNLWKFSVAWPNIPALKAFAKDVEERVGLQCLWSWEDQIDMALPGTGKGQRIAEYVESKGLSMQDVICFGDNFNDVSMLEMAGLGVAMGNHAEGVEKHANLVIGDNNSDAIAKTLEQYVL